MYLEEYFYASGIRSDIFYIDISVEAPVYCAPLNSKVQFTDYYPSELHEMSGADERNKGESSWMKFSEDDLNSFNLNEKIERMPVSVMKVEEILQYLKSSADRIVI